MNLPNPLIGNVSMLFYVITTAFSIILIHETNQTVAPLLAAFYTFIYCLLAYTSVVIRRFGKFNLLREYFVIIILLNITTAICWMTSFLALKYLPAELFLFIYLCAMSITSACIYKFDFLKICLYLSGLILLSLTYVVDHLLYGFLLAFLGGISGTVYSIYAKRITNYFTSLEILALRFYLTVLLTFFINLFLNAFHWMSFSFYLNFASLCLISVILPLFFFQVGISHLNINRTMSYLPYAPLLCYLFTSINNHSKFDGVQFSAVTFLFASMVFCLHLKSRKVNPLIIRSSINFGGGSHSPDA